MEVKAFPMTQVPFQGWTKSIAEASIWQYLKFGHYCVVSLSSPDKIASQILISLDPNRWNSMSQVKAMFDFRPQYTQL